jgi:hypothetical protein
MRWAAAFELSLANRLVDKLPPHGAGYEFLRKGGFHNPSN